MTAIDGTKHTYQPIQGMSALVGRAGSTQTLS